jgi:hypothetical protein
MQPSSNEVFLKREKKGRKDEDEKQKGEIAMNWKVYLQRK